MAETWAEQCVFYHDPSLQANGVGQNIRYSSSEPSVNISGSIDDWYNETHMYNYDTNTCSPDKDKCGHYTAVRESLLALI